MSAIWRTEAVQHAGGTADGRLRDGAGARHPLDTVARWAREDARLTHPNQVCLDANALFAMALAHAIRTGPAPDELYERIVAWAEQEEIRAEIRTCVEQAATAPPAADLADSDLPVT